MDNVATAKIKAFGNSPKANFVSPSEQLITLTIGQLQDLIREAIQPLQDEVESFRVTVARQNEKIAALELELTGKDGTKLGFHEDIMAQMNQRLAKLERVEPQPMQKDRGDILRALLAANGGKMLAKDARQKMHLGKEQFSLLISKMGEYIEAKPLHQDRRKLLLIIK